VWGSLCLSLLFLVDPCSSGGDLADVNVVEHGQVGGQVEAALAPRGDEDDSELGERAAGELLEAVPPGASGEDSEAEREDQIEERTGARVSPAWAGIGERTVVWDLEGGYAGFGGWLCGIGSASSTHKESLRLPSRLYVHRGGFLADEHNLLQLCSSVFRHSKGT
jgi:hypothetical protein